MAAPAAKEILTDLSPIIKVYTDGTVDRLVDFPTAPPSPEDPTTGVASRDAAISPSISARLYLPKSASAAAQKLPILVYYHGGGFCIGSAFTAIENRYANILSAAAGAIVVSVEYRLAPEHPLPAAYEDSWEALRWVCLGDDPWVSDHGDPARIFVGGDSAGGNIAHNVVIRAGSDPLPGNVRIRGGVFSCPYFLGVENESGNPTIEFLRRIWQLVHPSAGGGIDDPLINPGSDGAPSLSGMGCSRILICVAEKDALTNRAVAYAEHVAKSGWAGEVDVVRVEGEDHCFQVFHPERETAKDLINRIASFISN